MDLVDDEARCEQLGFEICGFPFEGKFVKYLRTTEAGKIVYSLDGREWFPALADLLRARKAAPPAPPEEDEAQGATAAWIVVFLRRALALQVGQKLVVRRYAGGLRVNEESDLALPDLELPESAMGLDLGSVQAPGGDA